MEKQIISSDREICLSFVENYMCLGKAVINVVDPYFGVFYNIEIIPEIRGKGIGSKMFREVLEVADNRGMVLICSVDPLSGINYDLVMHLLKKSNFHEDMYNGFPCYKRDAVKQVRSKKTATKKKSKVSKRKKR